RRRRARGGRGARTCAPTSPPSARRSRGWSRCSPSRCRPPGPRNGHGCRPAGWARPGPRRRRGARRRPPRPPRRRPRARARRRRASGPGRARPSPCGPGWRARRRRTKPPPRTGRSASPESVEQRRSARPREPLDGLEQLARLLLGLLAASGGERPGHAVVRVLLEQLLGDRFERGRDGADLGQDVDAVALVGNHLLDPAHLALDPVQARDQGLLVVHVAVAHAGASSVRAALMPRKRRRRSEFPTTNRLDAAIAAAAMIGLSSPAAARGIAATL